MANKFQLNFDISNHTELFPETQVNYGKEDYKESVKIDGVKLPKDNIVRGKIGNDFFMMESPYQPSYEEK